MKIIAGGQEFWTDKKETPDPSFEQTFDMMIPQGYRNIVVEVWMVSGLLSSKHRCAHRIIDIHEVVVGRRAYGCVKKEAFSLVPKPDGSSDAAEYLFRLI